MSKELESSKEKDENILVSFNSEKKKHYSEPNLIALGSMQRITQGGGSRPLDSGIGPGTFDSL